MRRIKYILTKNWLFLLILFFGIFLRFYRFEEFVTFLGDQGRDAIIIKRILTGEHFPAIGAPTSIGQVYLGPFYYYFIAPWLLIFRFNPVGLAFGVAFFSSLFLIINFMVVKKIFDKKTALISTFLISFSYVLIDLSRFSWNPNLLPLFSFLTVLFLYQSLKTEKWYYFALTGAFLSFSIQLHYLALSLGLPIGVILMINFFKNLKSIKKIIIHYSLLIINFLLFTSPLFIFDLRHNFLNSKNLLTLLQSSTASKLNFFQNFIDTFSYLNYYIFNYKFAYWINIILIISIIASFASYFYRRKDNFYYLHFVFLSMLLFLSLYTGPKHPHYLGVLYPFYLLLIARYLSFLQKTIFEKTIIFIFLASFVFLNNQKYSFLYYRGGNQIAHSKKIAQFLKEKINNKPFNIATWPVDFTEDNYLYFLEIEGNKPANRQKVEITNQMFVLCNKKPCQIINSPSWNISMFGKAKITNEWTIDNVKIYKLTR
ncbi:MAG: hypothetical protein Fur009_1770 [Candidatus Microgenomates bacterium]